MKKIMLFLITIFTIHVSAQHAADMLPKNANPNTTVPELTTGSPDETTLPGKSGRATNYWTGAANVVWSNSNNWSLGHLPKSDENVVISGTKPNQPVIYGGTYATCRDLTLESGAELIQHGTFSDQSFIYVYGDLNTDDGLYTMNNNYTHLYFMGSGDNIWDDDNENDTYANVRIHKGVATAQTIMYQDMTVNGVFTVQYGVFAINVQWELTVTNTHTEAFSVNSGGKLLLGENQKLSVAGGIVFRNGSSLETHSGSEISCGRDFKAEPNAAYNIEFEDNSWLKMNGAGDQYIIDDDIGMLRLDGLIIDKPSGTVYIANYDLYVNGALNLLGNSTLSCKMSPTSLFSNDIFVRNNWHQDATADFEAATGRVIFNGPDHVQCEGNPEFYELEISKDPGAHWEVNGDVSCAVLDYGSGTIEMAFGSFTANDLHDNGIYGSYILADGTIVNLTNNDGYIDLNGSLTFNGGGTMNIYGGTSDSWWSYDGDASVTMDAGVLDFHDRGVRLYDGSHTFTTDISGGTIRTAKGFYGDNTGFDPAGGTVYCYTTSDGSLELAPTNNFHNLTIDKSSKSGSVNPNLETLVREGEISQTDSKSNTMTMISDMTINGNLTIASGILDTDVHDIDIGGNWKNLVGPNGFLENENYVNFTGADDADIKSGETFYTLALSKTNTGFDALEIQSGETLIVNGDLNLIDGGLEMNDNSTIDVAGNVTIMSGAGLNMYNDANVALFAGGNWDNYNTYYNASGVGFHPGNGIVTFDGSGDQDLNTAAPHEEFFNLIVDKPSYNVRTFDNLYIWGDFQALDFALVNPVTSLIHYFFGDVYIGPSGYLHSNETSYVFKGTNDQEYELLGSTAMMSYMNVLIDKTPAKSAFAPEKDGEGTVLNYQTDNGKSGTVTLKSGLRLLNGVLTIDEGTLVVNGNTIEADDGIVINDGGTITVGANGRLELDDGGQVNVNDGGILELMGSAGNEARVTRKSGYYDFDINSGGTISAEYCIFEYTKFLGVYVKNGSVVDPAHAFNYCTFRNGFVSGLSSFLTINNSQDLTITGAIFPDASTAAYNVAKDSDLGTVTMAESSGAFAGEEYEYDPHGRINWQIPISGLWTGAVSSDWHVPGNWDGGGIPDATVDVTIPSGCPNYPSVESAGAECAGIVVEAGANLRIHDETLSVTNSLDIFGTMTMDHADGELIASVIRWKSGSDDLNMNAGNILVMQWFFDEGTQAQIGPGNTLTVSAGLLSLEPEASVGNLIFHASPTEKIKMPVDETYHLNVAGNMTIMNGELSVGWMNYTILGDLIISPGATFLLNSVGDVTIEVFGNLLTEGNFWISENLIVHGEPQLNETGMMSLIGTGQLLCDMPASEKALITMNGTFGIHDDAVLEITHNSLVISSTASTEITGGTIRCGGSFIANADGNFTPENLTVEMIAETANYYVQLHENNFIPNLHINGAASTYLHSNVQVTDNLIIDGGGLNLSTYNFYIGGDWQNNAGPAYFTGGESTVTFTGSGNSTITTDETFYNLVVDKPDPIIGFLILDDGVTINVENDLEIADGTLEMNDNSTLDVDNDLNIAADAGLNAYSDTGLEIYLAGNWYNHNALYDDHTGFNPGTSTIIFDGMEDEQELVTTADFEEFYNMVINKTGGIGTYSVNINENIRVLNDLHLIDGFWHAFGFTEHEILGDIVIEPDGYFSNLLASLTLSGEKAQQVQVDGNFSTSALTVHKSLPANQVTAGGHFSAGQIFIEEGSATFTTSRLYNVEELSVNDGGTLSLVDSCYLSLESGATVNVNSGGTLIMHGSETKENAVFTEAKGTYTFQVHDGGFLSSEYVHYRYMNADGVRINPGAFVDPDHAFNNCTFSWGDPGGVFLSINNDQDLFIDNITFNNIDWDMQANISKTADAGEIFVTSHSGSFSGEGFDDDPFDRIQWENGPEQHFVPIADGWSGISSYIEPMSLSLPGMFGQLDDFVMAYNQLGIYYPAYNINTIGSWPIKGVFVLKNESSETMIVSGYPDTDKTVTVHNYWTLIPVVSRCPVEVDELFAPHPELVLIKEVAGYRVYWPEMGVNTIGSLQPGKAYYALAGSGFSFTYADCAKGFDASKQVRQFAQISEDDPATKSLFNSAGWDLPEGTPATHSIAVSGHAVEDFEKGSLLGVFDHKGDCYGYVALNGKQTCLTAFGNDEYDADKNGFLTSEAMYFRLLKPSSGEVFHLEPTYNPFLPQSDGNFSENGLSQITGFKAGSAATGEVISERIKISPNPTDGQFEISNLEPGMGMLITDPHGQIVYSRQAAETSEGIDLRHMPPGLYFISVETQSAISVHKLILK